MATNHLFCRARAAEARRDAEAADLDNVRDRHLTAAAAWDVMAARGERTQRKRVEDDARKAAAPPVMTARSRGRAGRIGPQPRP